MPRSFYRILCSADGWVIEHDEGRSGGYEVPEAAFEAAAVAASLDLKQRRDITISVEFPEGPEDTEILAVDSEPAVQQSQFDGRAGKSGDEQATGAMIASEIIRPTSRRGG